MYRRLLNLTILPANLTKNGLFCCWRYEDRDGKQTKVPYQPDTGLRAKSNDPSSFVSYDTAVQAKGYDGIGIGIFNGVCAIDLDNCVIDSGRYTETAAEIVTLMHSYTELSPSGNGLHILFWADGFCYDINHFYVMNHQAGIEVYVAGATNKYVTVTGKKCEPYDFGDRTAELQILLERYMARPATNAANAINAVKSDLSIDGLLRRAKNSKNGAAFMTLWDGSTKGYDSQSEADLALCNYLAYWTGKDATMMDTMFRRSGLMRDKWDRPQAGTTYGAITIHKAIESCKEVYNSKQESKPQFLPLVPLTPQGCDLPPFPTDALPDVIQKYVNAVAEHSQTSPDMAAVISLGVLATCLQGKYRVAGTPGYYEPLSLYTVVIAAPGERKSSVVRAMTQYLYDYEVEYNKARSDEMQAQAEETKKLEAIRFFTDDCTSEALTSLMAANKGVISVISAEGGIFDILAGRYSNKANLDIWLKGHCGDTVYVDRVSRDAECILHPALSAILTIQPSVLEEIMSNTTMSGRGLIARFLYSSPPSRIGGRTFRAPAIPSEVGAAYRSLIFHLMALPITEEPQTLYLSEEAFDLIADYFEAHEQYLVGEGQAISDWASKYIGTVLRIAGLLYCADVDDENGEIPVATMKQAIQIGKYFLAHATYAYAMMGTDLSVQKAKFVMAKLKKQNITTIKRSVLFQNCRGKFFKKTEEIFPTLELLEEHGYLRMEEPERQSVGRPADVKIYVNPIAM